MTPVHGYEGPARPGESGKCVRAFAEKALGPALGNFDGPWPSPELLWHHSHGLGVIRQVAEASVSKGVGFGTTGEPRLAPRLAGRCR